MTEAATEATTERAEPRDFAAFLMEHRRGKTHQELSEALRDLVLSVEETRKAGKITYTLTIRPQERTPGAVMVADQIKCSLPEHDRSESIFFATDAGELVRNDPRQTALFSE
ncbi:hypothetical protein [Amycolatopsis albispora]|uniref:Uncharacterized protein n=1 Tax=Amycolatopsis albispora TaxID=1804986 RepID=A0A344KZQ0_9PSEU|nr:hypothetical protein [Amycolatopsis albispora]AXB41274.1 hypothetical protein A4R43_01040 [Amycolatopsis albispora]